MAATKDYLFLGENIFPQYFGAVWRILVWNIYTKTQKAKNGAEKEPNSNFLVQSTDGSTVD